ncbi:hypothetical protein NEDG_02127 [Nematocida displodere]|uniref:Uncharacterized protein n=1 Tax=Nematocida displodere TaxID=1805483 RepID=A0A177EER0_9MICR|nr:hypothetical protein NEDG_01437 [Nematocida displodere]OAG32260.1 hypothetical protein NEDG_02127 [Nematocida displodere]
MQRSKWTFKLSVLVLCLSCIFRCKRYHPETETPEDLNVFSSHQDIDHGIENLDSFISVIEKMLYKYPSIKSKMFIMLKKNLDPSSSLLSSNPNKLFTSSEGMFPDPQEIFAKFKSILDAEEMLKEDLQGVLRTSENYMEILNVKKKGWISAMKDLDGKLISLKERKARVQSRQSSIELEAEFETINKKIHDLYDAIKKGDAWDKRLCQLLTELFP